ncbi:putative pentatricopeptide [Rosa chinensis]|uniref:Putative pentatricopeptide n=1 Tax=Rosa chinensis TaxID=74649 RepID=A0A2P6S4F9_ROSCH|nr:putative pentatricopeptide [Rosa chinensis]
MFEFLESRGGYEVGSSTYDALVSACISLKSIGGVKRVLGYMIGNGFELDQSMRTRVLLMHVKCGMMIDTRHLFEEMPERNLVYFLIRSRGYLPQSSAGLGLIFAGRQFHSCCCGSIEDAHCVFDEMSTKTIVGWNTIIVGYALHGYSEEALSMYYDMCDSGVPMDHFTFSMTIRTCARLASLEHAKQAHAGLFHYSFGLDIVANTSLVEFYSKWEG